MLMPANPIGGFFSNPMSGNAGFMNATGLPPNLPAMGPGMFPGQSSQMNELTLLMGMLMQFMQSGMMGQLMNPMGMVPGMNPNFGQPGMGMGGGIGNFLGGAPMGSGGFGGGGGGGGSAAPASYGGGGSTGYSGSSSSGGSVSGGSSGSSGSSVAPAGGPSGNATPGAKAMMKRAGSMVGMTETGNTSEIMKITGKSGINPASTPWCSAFAMNLIDEHGLLDLDGLSNRNYVPTVESWARDKGVYGTPDQYTPKTGDAIVFDFQQDGTSDHIGLVESVKNGKVYTIEGNSSDSVKRNVYDLGDSSIDGYVVTKEAKSKPKTGGTSSKGSSSTPTKSSGNSGSGGTAAKTPPTTSKTTAATST